MQSRCGLRSACKGHLFLMQLMSASRPNAVIIAPSGFPIIGHCISKVDMADLLDKAVTGSRGAHTLGKNHRYRYKFELARDANANQILTKYGGFVRLLQR